MAGVKCPNIFTYSDLMGMFDDIVVYDKDPEQHVKHSSSGRKSRKPL